MKQKIITNHINDIGLPLVQVLMEVNNGDTTYYTHGNDLISMKKGGASSYYQYDGLGTTR
ncbi:MAG: hypothetical protein PHW62_04015 [Candidatus Ratteibacteria bacterium]|nr:hypothetical protein [Candidatus Ratteibacteria bacterium]